MTDLWIPRLYVLGQMAVLVICGALIALGHNSTITDIFAACSGGLILTSGYTKLIKGKEKTTATK
jgi:glycopeptide antibiotics resistance protein